jgi:hypothetical protein
VEEHCKRKKSQRFQGNTMNIRFCTAKSFIRGKRSEDPTAKIQKKSPNSLNLIREISFHLLALKRLSSYWSPPTLNGLTYQFSTPAKLRT